METGAEMVLNLILKAEKEQIRREKENKNKIQKPFYYKPTQVHFFDPNCRKYCYGIAYHDIIICACCGLVLNATRMRKIQELPWVSFVKDIRNDSLPYDAED